MNLWHDIAPGNDDEMNVIIEIPRGSKNKYEIDKKTGLIALDRVLHSAQNYPFDYGFIPQTLWDDGDALDAVILTTEPLHPGILVRMRAVGIMDMVDGGEPDAKLIGVPVHDPRWNGVQDLKDVNPHTLKEIEHFFTTYKQIQGKVCTIDATNPRSAALAAFARGQELYKKKFNK